MATIASLYRYPIKGLSPEQIASADLSVGNYFPTDRLYAIENGPSGFDPAAPEHQPKSKFLVLARHEQLARLATRYDEATASLTVQRDGAVVCEADLSTEAGRNTLAAFMTDFMEEDLPGPRAAGALQVLEAPPVMRFTDSSKGYLSLINLASVAALGAELGQTLDPLRFRGNLHLADLPAWAENEWVGKTLAIGEVRLEVLKRTQRCAATNVELVTATRDSNIPKALMKTYGHADCGVYAQVVRGGRIGQGDRVIVEG